MPEKIIWSPAAQEDLESILEYLKHKWSQAVVAKFINKVDDMVNLIAEDYKLFPVINNDLNIRKCVVTKQNMLYYRGDENKLEIIRVFDSRQDPEKLKLVKK